MNTAYRSLEERLLANSVPVFVGFMLNGERSECWEWIGNRDSKGYGRLSMRQEGKRSPTAVRAHRISHQVFMGVTLKEEDTLEHLCRWTSCIHPNHTVPCPRAVNTKLMHAYWRNYRAQEAGQVAMDYAT